MTVSVTTSGSWHSEWYFSWCFFFFSILRGKPKWLHIFAGLGRGSSTSGSASFCLSWKPTETPRHLSIQASAAESRNGCRKNFHLLQPAANITPKTVLILWLGELMHASTPSYNLFRLMDSNKSWTAWLWFACATAQTRAGVINYMKKSHAMSY